MRILTRLIVAMVALVSFTAVVNAQVQKGIPTDGRDFYIAAPPPGIKCSAITPFQGTFVLICSYYNDVVDISYFGDDGREIPGPSKQVAAKNYVTVPLDPVYMGFANASGERPEYRACHIHSHKGPISVSFYGTGPVSGGMYLALPTGALGKQYIVATLGANPAYGVGGRRFSCSGDKSSSEFMVIAVKDNTTVKFIPNSTTLGGKVGVSSGPQASGTKNEYSVMLNRGQVYLVKSTADELEDDMSGTMVTADQPIAVIADQEAAYNGETKFASFGGDQRDLSIEQMIPVDYWTSDGYASMPMLDSPDPASDDASQGDMYRIFTYDTNQSAKVEFNIDQVGARQVDVTTFPQSPTTFGNVQTGVIARSLNGQKIMVEMYEYREMNNREPYPAPSQMNVVPMARWRTSYMWAVPDDKNQVHKKRLINVIARSDQFTKIKIARNGGALQPITSYPGVGTAATIPGHPELRGRRFEIGPGCYYATADSAFGVCQYGYLGLDPDFDLGDNDDDDYYFSYATTCGQTLAIDGAYAPKLSVDTACSSWHIHMEDNNPLDHGLSLIDILNDPNGVLKRKPKSDSGYISTNVAFDPFNYTVTAGDTVADAKIIVLDPLSDAEAWVWALNGAGNDTLLHLTYKAPSLSLTPKAGFAFTKVAIGVDTCARFVFRNNGGPNDRAFTVKDAIMKSGGQGFRVSSTTPTLPFLMKPGDSVVVFVCVTPTQLNKTLYDSLVVETDCPNAIGPLTATTTHPLIDATDWDFGTVLVGKTACHDVLVTNVGDGDLLLTKDYLLHDNPEFTFSDDSKLPMTLKPGESVNLNFCYTPTDDSTHDSSRCDWGTNIEPPFEHQKKDFSLLYGRGVKPDISWDRPVDYFKTVCDTIQRDTLWLRNYGTATIHVDSVRITGLDAAEYKIVDYGKRRGETPPENFDLESAVGVHDSTWVAIMFTPDLTQANPWHPRNDTLWAYDRLHINPYVVLNADVRHADITVDRSSIDLGSVLPGATTHTEKIVIHNPGDAGLLIDSLYIDNPAFHIVAPSAGKGTIIPPGGYDTVTVEGTMSTEGTATGVLTVSGAGICPHDQITNLTMSASLIAVKGTPRDYQPTYLCKNSVDHVTVTSSGSRDAKLISIDIVDDPAAPGQSSEFHFPDGTRSKTVNATLTKDQPYNYDIVYEPTIKAAAKAQVKYTYDTASGGSKPWTEYEALTGTGMQEHQTVSAAKVDGTIYTAKTEDEFEVPIRMTESIPAGADVHSATFDFTYRRDMFRWLNMVDVPGYHVANVGAPTVNGTLETRSITVTPTTKNSFDIADDIAHVHLQLLIAKDTNSDFTISNLLLQDSHGDDICYVLHDVISANFTPIDLCANGMIRRFMQTGQLTFNIKSVSPNPASSVVNVKLDVHEANSPVMLELYTVLGTRVRAAIDSKVTSTGAHTSKLDVTGLAEGSYTLRVVSGNQVETRQITIKH